MDLLNILEATYDGCFDIAIPGKIIHIVYMIVTIMKFGIPLLLIIFGMLDLGKAVIASKEDEIKKGQQMFIKRTITAVIVFFVVTVVQLVVNVATDSNTDEGSNIVKCIDIFMNDVECNTQTCTPKK